MQYPHLKKSVAWRPSVKLAVRAFAVAMMLMRVDAPAFSQERSDALRSSEDDKFSEVEFNGDFLPKDVNGKAIDVSHFARGNPVYPGTYLVKLRVNDSLLGRADVEFVAAGDALHAKPCFDHTLLQRIDVDLAAFSGKEKSETGLQQTCDLLERLVPDASIYFDSADQELVITIPQAFMKKTSRGYVDPSLWDQGINAGLLNYNFNAYHSASQGNVSTDLYLGLNGGINLGRWRFRHNGSLTSAKGRKSEYQSVSTFARYAIVPWKSELTIGDGFTDGAVFDSFGFRGVSLASDDRMLPETQRGFAPVVRGVALSNANVTIRQNGNLLYETTVPPGPFEINDLYSTGSGGDLEVLVTEADGTKRNFSVPYSSVPQALRPGVYRYTVTAGQYREQGLKFKSNVLAASYQRGLTNIVTLYGGLQFAERYGSAALGMALNTGLGALSGDVSAATTELPGRPRQTGQSFQIRFAKVLPATDTNLTVAAYRYSTSGYLSLADAMAAADRLKGGLSDYNLDREKARLQLSMSQSFGQKWGSIYLTGQSQNYWNRGNSDTSFQLGYTNSIARVFYNASISRSRVVSTGQWDNRYFISFTVPLGGMSNPASITTNLSYSDSGKSTQAQTSLSGSLGEHNEFSYNVSGNYDHSKRGSGGSGSVNGNYASSVGTFGASAGAGKHTQQYSLNASGGVILHGMGLTFGPPLGETNTVVEAKGAKGAYINGLSNNRVNSFGYGIVPSLSPYVLNRIEIDPKGLPLDVELKTTGQDVAPLAGAVIKTVFETDNRRTIILTTRRSDGTALPFGSEVINREGISVGQVSQGGRVLARGVAEIDSLIVKWGSGPEENCTIEIRAEQHQQGICR
jgi:outer membrane usher protein